MSSNSRYPFTEAILEEVWTGLGGDPSWLDGVEFLGDGNLQSPFALTDLAAATFGAFGLALAELLAASGSIPPSVRVDRVLSSGWFDLRPSAASQPVVPRIPGPNQPWFNGFEVADGRWIRLQGVYSTQLKRIAAALGVAPEHEAIGQAIRTRDADSLEQFLADSGVAVAANRLPEEWLAHPAGRAVDGEPIGDVRLFPSEGSTWRAVPGRPLAGLKVLDMTRVVAGPTATRILAAAGAEVLRLDAPGSEEAESPFWSRGTDNVLGKRWASLDLRTSSGLAQFTSLLADADVFVHGYRPGGIDSIISEDERRAIRPNLVEVTHNAFGWTSPWKMRRGFDTIVQWSTGLADATSAWAAEDPVRRLPLNMMAEDVMDVSRPRHLVVEALDIGTGYQIATAVLRGLTRRIKGGDGSSTRLSLARTASTLINTGFVNDVQEWIKLPVSSPVDDRVYSTPAGPVRRLKLPVEVQGNPLFWERGIESFGASNPIWSLTTAPVWV